MLALSDSTGLKVLYLAHDLSDATVAKRLRMLKDGGAAVSVAGFRRSGETIHVLDGTPVVDLGLTTNGGFAGRVWAVLKTILRLRRLKKDLGQPDVILARNLEMLAIGRSMQKYQRITPLLFYEILDIHRFLIRQDIVGNILRAIERHLLKAASGILTSSPAYIREYFGRINSSQLPILLIENKVSADIPLKAQATPITSPPWVIGWFGILRCRKSLLLLKDLTQALPEKVRVILRGKPALDQIPDFDELVAASPGLSFQGPYQNPADLQSIYESVHFSWSIDLYEDGLNSSWLLPNRIYEGGYFKTVPIACTDVETGRFLKDIDAGVLLDEPLSTSLQTFFEKLDPHRFSILGDKSRAIPRRYWSYKKSDCKKMVDFLTQNLQATDGELL